MSEPKKTPDKIKKGLECCHGQYSASCGKCPYSKDGIDCGINGVQIMKDALTYIQQLEADLEAVRRERDAAVADLGLCGLCKVCKHMETKCNDCRRCKLRIAFCDKFEWRGVCPENTEVQADE